MDLQKYSIDWNATILEGLKKIESNNEGFICLVNEENKLKGVLTDGDIRRQLIKSSNLQETLKNFSNEEFSYLYEDADFHEVVNNFKDAKILFLPIISKTNELKNILTKKQLHDLLIKGEFVDLKANFEQHKQTEVFEIYNRPWGFYKTTILSEFVQAKVLHVFPQQKLSLQYHKKREEHWVVIKGQGMMTIGESLREVKAGSYIFIPKGCQHRVENISNQEPLIISEVQLGDYFGEDDIIRIEDIYNRI